MRLRLSPKYSCLSIFLPFAVWFPEESGRKMAGRNMGWIGEKKRRARMPIEVQTDIRSLSEDEFKEAAYVVSGAAFGIHNRFGNLFRERVYKCELARECVRNGFERVEIEVPVQVSFESFRKEYFLDLLVNGSALFELKAEAAIAPAHRAQTLNYLFMTGLQRAKIFNFGTTRVQHEFVSTTLTSAERRRFAIDDQRWRDCGAEGHRFRKLLVTLLNDWGCFLQLPLYQAAITHFFGGDERVVRLVRVTVEGETLTTQPTHTLNPTTAFKLTATPDIEIMEDALRRFLHHTELTAIQWVNLHNHDITFVTLFDPKQ